MPDFHLGTWELADGRWGWSMRFGTLTHRGIAASRAAAWERAFNARAFALWLLALPAGKHV